ncbi:MAG: glycoside hydrolase family 5 protein [Rhodopila sp.]
MRRGIIGVLALVLASAFIALLRPDTFEAMSSPKLMFVGVNLPSATFAEHKLPGKVGEDYFYPSREDMEYFIRSGMNTVRLGFIWERLQPVLNAPFDSDEAQRLDDALKTAIRLGATVILDLHNYAHYRHRLVGSDAVPDESFADFWWRLATIYGKNDSVAFGLMNEPYGISADQWRHSAQVAIDRIRQTGAGNLVLVSSSQWDGASHFVADGDVWDRIVDPAGNFAFEVHQYLDVNNSGTHRDCPNTLTGVTAIQSVTKWMQRTKHRALLSETGASERNDCLTALSHMLDFMQQHPDVWLGWTYFAGGRGWADDDILSIQPVSKIDRPQMEVLRTYLH